MEHTGKGATYIDVHVFVACVFEPEADETVGSRDDFIRRDL